MAANKTSKRKDGGRDSADELERRQREITGIALIAAGVVLAIYMTISASNFLGTVGISVLFGLCGLSGFALPVLLFILGILTIKGGRNIKLRGSPWFVALGALALMTLMQVIHNPPYENVDYMHYLDNAYKTGATLHLGGGFVGGALCYPLLLLGGNVLTYAMSIALILIAIVAVTGLSIGAVGAKVGESVHTAVKSMRDDMAETDRERKKMPTFDLVLEGEAPAKSNGRKSAKAKSADLPLKADKPLKKVSKRKQKTMLEDVDELVSILPLDGEFRDTPRRQVELKPLAPIVPDIWSDLEPQVDVPLTITPVQDGGFKPEPAPLPDTAQLFGAQTSALSPEPEEKPSGKGKGRKSQNGPADSLTAKAAKPIRVGDGPKDKEAELPDIQFTNAPSYIPPSFSLLTPASVSYGKGGESPEAKAKLLVETLESFRISAKVINISVGPVLTRFELQPAPGVRVSRITSLSNDIALALAAQRVRIEAPIPGKSAVGIEIPNKNTVTVVLRDIVESKEFQKSDSAVTMALGKDISGNIIVTDLAKMPHMLIAGATGSGKSVCINDIIISMVYKSSPAELKMVLIDPKMVELSVFGVLPHLLIPVVTEPKKAAGALRWAVNEMTQRYKKFSDVGARDLKRYNQLMDTPELRLPKLVVIIDELADLMMVSPDDVEDSICRIAQLGRAAGIHLIVATQRPSADIITGLIKANIPSRCAFAVSSGIDSRIILDATGAEKLLGRGDMLFHPNGAGKPTRVQCAFVSDEEVERIVNHFKKQAAPPTFDEQVIADMDTPATGGAVGGAFGEGKQEDDLLGAAVRVVLENGVASTSMLQRRLRVGYTRGSRLIDIMEEKGFVSPYEGSKPRKVLISKEQYAELFNDTLPIADPKMKADQA